jgi:hypothetical protein
MHHMLLRRTPEVMFSDYSYIRQALARALDFEKRKHNNSMSQSIVRNAAAFKRESKMRFCKHCHGKYNIFGTFFSIWPIIVIILVVLLKLFI